MEGIQINVNKKKKNKINYEFRLLKDTFYPEDAGKTNVMSHSTLCRWAAFRCYVSSLVDMSGAQTAPCDGE